jgi:putative transposase
VRQFLAELPTRLTAPCRERALAKPIKVFAQDESRVGLWPIVRRRITACGVQPIATVAPAFDYFYLYGAVEPTTGASFFLELPGLNTVTFQLWLDHCAQAFPESCNLLVLDNGAFHKAHALQWPSNVVPVFLPPYSPELNPMERVWRDLKDKLAGISAKTLTALSEAVCTIIQHYSQATLHSLTGFRYFVQAVETAQKAIYG